MTSTDTTIIRKCLASLISSRCSNNFDQQHPPVNKLNLPSFLLPHSECLLQSHLRNVSRSEIKSLQTVASVYLITLRDNNNNHHNNHQRPEFFTSECVPSSPFSISQINNNANGDDSTAFFDETSLTSWETRAFEALVDANHLVFSETQHSNNNNNHTSNNLKSFLQELSETSSSPSRTLLEILAEEVLCSSLSFGGFTEIVATENSKDSDAEEEGTEMNIQNSTAIDINTQTQNTSVTKKSFPTASTSSALLHKILPTRNTKLTEILNGGLRTGSLIEICSSSKVGTNNNNNNSSPYYYFDEVTGEKYKIETDHHFQQQNSKNSSDEGIAAILAALNMIPNAKQFGKTAVLSLSSNATNLFLQTFLDFTTRADNGDKEILSSDDIVFEEYVLPPTSVSATRQKSLLDHLPAIESKLVNISNSPPSSSVDAPPVAMLMLLDLDAAMKDAITAVSILNKNYMSSASSNNNNNLYTNNSNNKMLQSLVMQQQQTKNGSNSNNTSSSLLDFYGDKLLGELKKMAVRLNTSIVIVRLTDSSDLMLDASAVLANLSSALTFHHNADESSNSRGNNNNNNRSFVNGSNNGNVGSYHAVNCRIRAGFIASQGTNNEECDSILSIEVCKSAWCAMSINTI